MRVQHSVSGLWNSVCRGVLLAALGLVAFSTRAGESWAARAGQMNRREISADAARAGESTRVEDRRNKISMPRIRPAMGGVDWDTDPTAVPYVHYQINKRTELPVYVFNDGLDLASPDLFRYTMVYLTSHGRWALNEKETANLALWLKRGGSLYLDDCYNRGSAFAESVRPEVGKLIPGGEPTLLLKEDPRVADAFRLVYPTPWPGDAAFENRAWQYVLLDGRPAVFFSPNDDGCSWEISTPPTASNPLGEGIGHGGDNTMREIMYQWAANWVVFALTH